MSALDANEIEGALTAGVHPWKVRVLDEVTSTNDVAKTMVVEPGDWLAVFAESQTQGRGRRGNRWHGTVGQDLLFTVVFRPAGDPAWWARATTLAALAVVRTIEKAMPLQARIKWPNDVYIDGRKCCGLLAELTADDHGARLMLGIGLNVNRCEFPDELKACATSLRLALPPALAQRPLERNPLAAMLLDELSWQMDRMADGFGDALEEVRTRSWLLGRQVRANVEGVEIHGRAVDLNAEGHLILQKLDGTVRVLSSAEQVRCAI